MNNKSRVENNPVTVTTWPAAHGANEALKRAVLLQRKIDQATRLGVMTGPSWCSKKRIDNFRLSESGLRAVGVETKPGEVTAMNNALMGLTLYVGGLMALKAGNTRALHGWANILEPGGAVGMHDHNQSDYSAVYFVTEGSNLVIRNGPDLLEIPPQPGRIVIFSGLVRHCVDEHQGPGPRISIIYNRLEGGRDVI